MTSLVDQYVGATAYDVSGDKIGKIGRLFVDGRSREPKWAEVHTGLFRKSQMLIPLSGSRQEGRAVTLTVSKAAVREAPKVRVGEGVTVDDADRLSRHYRLDEPQPEAPQPPAPHSTALDIAAAAAGMGGTAVNTAAWSPAENQHPDMFEEPEPTR
ncbi:PRC-barrel domain-containing protein [Mycolicibacterium frederiksbergense]|uniref:PRC-barrel domain-containing protein n=1 Tax=Mycolicibacterium frederiksbergense TaxID=117567 RepID=UPI00399A514D